MIILNIVEKLPDEVLAIFKQDRNLEDKHKLDLFIFKIWREFLC